MSEYRQSIIADIGKVKNLVNLDVIDTQATQLEEQARVLRERGRTGFKDLLGQMAEKMREQDYFGSDLTEALLYFYGRDFNEEVVGNLHEFHPQDGGQLEEFIDAVEPLVDAVLPVPIIINSPQGYSDMHSRDTWREFHFVLADPDSPYYSRSRTKDNVAMHAFTGQTDTTVRRSFGIEGTSYQISTAMSNRSIGAVSMLGAKRVGNECEVLMTEHALNHRSGMPSTYSYSGDNLDLIHSTYGHNEYTVGWSAIEELVFEEPAGKRRVTAAKNVAKLLFPDYLKMEQHMPRVAKIIQATAALRDATGSE